MKRTKFLLGACLCAVGLIFVGCEKEGGKSSSGGGSEEVGQYVDLGLSVKWATCNLGASRPEECGDYYAWGETSVYYTDLSTNPITLKQGKEEGYELSSYSLCQEDGDGYYMTKYCVKSSYGYKGFVDNKTTLELVDDAAHVNLGDSWRMPTSAEFQELINNCKCSWVADYQKTGVSGYLFTSTVKGFTDRSIFLPAAGYGLQTYILEVGSDGSYWSSSLYESQPNGAYLMEFSSSAISEQSAQNVHRRDFGGSIRAVCE